MQQKKCPKSYKIINFKTVWEQKNTNLLIKYACHRSISFAECSNKFFLNYLNPWGISCWGHPWGTLDRVFLHCKWSTCMWNINFHHLFVKDLMPSLSEWLSYVNKYNPQRIIFSILNTLFFCRKCWFQGKICLFFEQPCWSLLRVISLMLERGFNKF